VLIARHHASLSDGAAAPEWVHLVPAGTFRGADGRGPYRLVDPQAVIAASMAAGRLPLDENHATDHAMASGIASPARGWIVEMAARDDGLWGRVEWTPSGLALMAERAYRGISPVFTHAKDGTVLTVLRAALTNTPNLVQLATLHSQSETSMDLTLLRQALGLPETADDAAILAAAAGVTTARQAQAAASAEAAQMAATVVALQTQLATLAADAARTRATAFIDGAIRAGKPINPLRDHFIARHMADATAVETEINALPSINAGGVATHAASGGDDEMPTAEEMSVAKKMGLDPKKLAAQRKKRMKADDGEKA
jgi:phage I-like protein